jgi:hypothetical protein
LTKREQKWDSKKISAVKRTNKANHHSKQTETKIDTDAVELLELLKLLEKSIKISPTFEITFYLDSSQKGKVVFKGMLVCTQQI